MSLAASMTILQCDLCAGARPNTTKITVYVSKKSHISLENDYFSKIRNPQNNNFAAVRLMVDF